MGKIGSFMAGGGGGGGATDGEAAPAGEADAPTKEAAALPV